MAKDKEVVLISLLVRPAQAAFIKAASAKLGIARANHMRNAMLQVSAKVLGKDAPECAPFVSGRSSPISVAAKALGLTSEQYMRKVTLDKLGVKESTPKAKRAKK